MQFIERMGSNIPGVRTLWPIDSSGRIRGTCMRGRGRVIDHIIAWPGVGVLPHSLKVGYSWDTSDHFPIFATVPCDSEITIVELAPPPAKGSGSSWQPTAVFTC